MRRNISGFFIFLKGMESIYGAVHFTKNIFWLILCQMNEVTAFDIMFNFGKQGHFKNIHVQEYSYLYSLCKRYSKIKDYKQKFEAVLLILRIKGQTRWLQWPCWIWNFRESIFGDWEKVKFSRKVCLWFMAFPVLLRNWI